MIDTHCHLNFDGFDPDRPDVIARARAAGVSRILIPAVDEQTSRQAVALAESIEGIYAAVGVHPNSTRDFDPNDEAWITTLAASDRVVAIGEIGLDYHWDDSPKDIQHRALECQLEIAAQLELPVIIHNRDAHDDMIAVLEAWVKTLPSTLRQRPGVMHSFSAPPAIAERALAAGFYLGFTGPLTYKNADELRHIAATTPLDRILTETDAPYLTPTPHRGKRNEPAYIPLIVDRLASLHQCTAEEMGRITTANAECLFALPAETNV